MKSKILEWIGEKAIDGAVWTAEKIGEGILWVLKIVGKGIAKGLIAVIQGSDAIFIIVAMVGVYFIMSGNRKLGTKLTSGSFLTYVLAKAVLGC